MKTKKILGLGVCALSLGMVAGVIGTRAAVEAKAVDPAITGWELVGEMNDWSTKAGYVFEHDNVYKVYSLTVSLANKDGQFKIRANSNWDDCVLSWQIADLSGGHITKDVGKDKNDQVIDGHDGTYTFTIKDTLTPTIAGNYQLVGDYVTVQRAEDTYEYDLRIVGTFSGEETSWDYATSVASEAKQDGNLYQCSGITLAANDEFKIATVNNTMAEVDWDKTIYGYGNLQEGGAAAKFEEGVDGELKPNGNIKVKTAGTYDVYVNSSGQVFIFDTPVPVVYTVKIGDGAPVELIKNTSASLAEGQKAEYYVEGKNVKKGDALVFAADTVAITSHIGGDEGSNTVFTTVEEVTSAKIHNDKDNANIYFKVWNDGGYSVYVTGYEQGPTGWYICNADTWGPADGKLSDGSNAQNAAYWLDVNMAAGYEFTIAEFADGERVQQYDLGWSDVAEDWSSEYAKFEAGASDNHIKVKTAGVYSIYVTSGETKKICLNGSGLTPEVIQKAKDLHDEVSAAGAEDYTETSEALRNKSCADKYEAALKDYNDLGEAGQKYFRDNYADDYAIMEYWHNKTTNPGSLYKVSGLATSNPTLIITISVIAGAVVASAGIYLISKKRKHN